MAYGTRMDGYRRQQSLNSGIHRSPVDGPPKDPLVSVIMPTYNRHDLLREAITSVIRQSYRRWELIVVDDGSSDETRPFLRSLEDERIRPVYRPHSGNIAAVRNAGIAASRGDLIGFLDSDDLLMSNSLELHVSALRANRDRAWSYGHHQLIDAAGRDIGPPMEGPSGARGLVVLKEIITDRAVPQTGAVAIRRRLFEEAGPFDESLALASDFDMWARIAIIDPGIRIDATLVRVRHHPERTTALLRVTAMSKASILTKLKGRIADRDLSDLCDRLAGVQLIKHAAELSRQNHPLQAMRVLRAASRLGGTPAAWWLELAKTLLRPVIGRHTLRR